LFNAIAAKSTIASLMSVFKRLLLYP